MKNIDVVEMRFKTVFCGIWSWLDIYMCGEVDVEVFFLVGD